MLAAAVRDCCRRTQLLLNTTRLRLHASACRWCCGRQVWRTDTGMSRWVKNGPLECLEILADGSTNVLTRTGVVPGVVRSLAEDATVPLQKRANSGAGERGFSKGAAPV